MTRLELPPSARSDEGDRVIDLQFIIGTWNMDLVCLGLKPNTLRKREGLARDQVREGSGGGLIRGSSWGPATTMMMMPGPARLRPNSHRTHDATRSKWDLLSSMGVFTLHATNNKGKTFQFACASRVLCELGLTRGQVGCHLSLTRGQGEQWQWKLGKKHPL